MFKCKTTADNLVYYSLYYNLVQKCEFSSFNSSQAELWCQQDRCCTVFSRPRGFPESGPLSWLGLSSQEQEYTVLRNAHGLKKCLLERVVSSFIYLFGSFERSWPFIVWPRHLKVNVMCFPVNLLARPGSRYISIVVYHSPPLMNDSQLTQQSKTLCLPDHFTDNRLCLC